MPVRKRQATTPTLDGRSDTSASEVSLNRTPQNVILTKRFRKDKTFDDDSSEKFNHEYENNDTVPGWRTAVSEEPFSGKERSVLKSEDSSGNSRLSLRCKCEPTNHFAGEHTNPDGTFVLYENELLAERYALMEKLGTGTSGLVLKALDCARQEYVAVKVTRCPRAYTYAGANEANVVKNLMEDLPSGFETHIEKFRQSFSYYGHVCLVTELLSKTLFDILISEELNPLPPETVLSFSQQLLSACAFLHSRQIIHTDIKPENICLVDSTQYEYPQSQFPARVGAQKANDSPTAYLGNTLIKLVDFAGAVTTRGFHPTLVTTCHYRSPEVCLGLTWSTPIDIWASACVIVEFAGRGSFFPASSNLSQLAIHQAVIGPIPQQMLKQCKTEGFVYPDPARRNAVALAFSQPSVSERDRALVSSARTIDEMLYEEEFAPLADLVSKMLKIEPRRRITAAKALEHPCFHEI